MKWDNWLCCRLWGWLVQIQIGEFLDFDALWVGISTISKGQWQSPCTALTASLPLGLCKGTVKESGSARCECGRGRESGRSYHEVINQLTHLSIALAWLTFNTWTVYWTLNCLSAAFHMSQMCGENHIQWPLFKLTSEGDNSQKYKLNGCISTELKMSFWWNFHNWLLSMHWKLSFV